MPYKPRLISRADGRSHEVARYSITRRVNNNNFSTGSFFSIAKAVSGRVIHIRSVYAIKGVSAAGTGTPVRVIRASNFAGGTLIAAADVPKLDTTMSDATAEVRYSASSLSTQRITYSSGAQIATFAASPAGGTVGLAGPMDRLAFLDDPDEMVLRSDQGIGFTTFSLDLDDLWDFTVVWEEEL